jgi:hypothetical protein
MWLQRKRIIFDTRSSWLAEYVLSRPSALRLVDLDTSPSIFTRCFTSLGWFRALPAVSAFMHCDVTLHASPHSPVPRLSTAILCTLLDIWCCAPSSSRPLPFPYSNTAQVASIVIILYHKRLLFYSYLLKYRLDATASSIMSRRHPGCCIAQMSGGNHSISSLCAPQVFGKRSAPLHWHNNLQTLMCLYSASS